jgi:Arc/MetJ family transcription regulator
MRTTVTLDDELLAQAQEATGVMERSTLLHEGLRLLIQREAARRLILLGGSMPDATLPPRRRSTPMPKTGKTTGAAIRRKAKASK